MIIRQTFKPLLKKLSVLEAKINQRSKRERALMLVVGIAFIFVMWNTLFHQSTVQERQRIQKESVTLQQQVNTIHVQINAILGANVPDATSADFKKKEELSKRVRDADAQFKKLAEQILSSYNVSIFLEKIIRGEGRLKIIELSSLPVESLLETGKKEIHAPYVELTPMALYKHPVSLILEGGYLDTLAFLEKIQKLAWRVFWDELDYRVVKYPVARVTLRFHTLSQQKGRIGI